jgi:hypothetical protein
MPASSDAVKHVCLIWRNKIYSYGTASSELHWQDCLLDIHLADGIFSSLLPSDFNTMARCRLVALSLTYGDLFNRLCCGFVVEKEAGKR